MGVLDFIKEILNKGSVGLENPTPLPSQINGHEKPKQKKSRPKPPEKTAKELATEKGEPYIAILSFDLDPDNLESGAFELDWNEKFITNLVRSGYQHRVNEPENVIVDRWFQEICRNVVLEYYEQSQADPDMRQQNKKNLGNGRSEFS